MTTATREMPPLPHNMQHLPVDPKRGYVVPRFVQWRDGQPDFRFMSADYLFEAVDKKLCWTCGLPLGKERGVFVIGPMCAVNCNTAEPPNHAECARFSAKACPFLSMPKMRRREDEHSAKAVAAGIPIKRNPGVTLLWFASKYRVIPDPNGLLFRLHPPLAVEWYSEGRTATREEIMHSIDTGLPILREMAEQDGPTAAAYLEFQIVKALRLVPKS